MQITRSNSTETTPGPADWFTGTMYHGAEAGGLASPRPNADENVY